MLIHPPPHTISYEWPMKNFSSHFPLLNSQTIANIKQQAGQEEEKNHDDDDDDEEEARCEWDFNLSAAISSPAASSDAIGVVEFDDSGTLLATGGIARKIRIYAADKSLKAGEDAVGVRVLDHAAACEFYICTPAKLSSIKWKPGSDSQVLGSGDYDGVVMEYDLVKRVPVFERDEHGGKRVWSMDYSRWDPTLGASGSDDGTMQMWDPRCEGGKCLPPIQPNRAVRSPVCCVEFNPFGGPLVVAGCADRGIYGYDVRRMVEPVFKMDRHEKAVTYTKFIDPRTIVSSSIDGCLMMWDAEEDSRLIRKYKGHVNTRRFVGLSVWRDGGLISCGSENNQVYVYDTRWGRPVWVRGLEPGSQPRREPGFVSGVCWRPTGEDRCMLVVGGSDGMLQVFKGERKCDIIC
ncbi:Transducin/WD40 repeat-like superfamily protein [Perilla frutescens var. hirtella]|uniref:Transducin/WD40 repeat-like superfamily protein n=1 Tax=Perilla frutescens var. hirtella TaxID=608512 RepID=A0AAD4JKX6_PERFH|nr:Transducin/WD40 repeat-like superfamily protein [Perilla frutescens var. hirtella]